jgi:hypothetical protein
MFHVHLAFGMKYLLMHTCHMVSSQLKYCFVCHLRQHSSPKFMIKFSAAKFLRWILMHTIIVVLLCRGSALKH